jgi:DNA polymerase-1
MTYSGSILRGKSKKPTGVPLHQWKRAKEFRDLIKAPEGYTLLEFDFSGQEFRWMAVLSDDQTMLEMCADGEDAHSYMGAQVHNTDYKRLCKLNAEGDKAAKEIRQLGKVANLSLQYRTSAATLVRVARVSYGLTLTEMEAKATHATYRTTYPNVPIYWKQQTEKVATDGWVETKAGRRINVGKASTWFTTHADGTISDNKWSCESTAINFPIQGSGADQKYLALAVLRSYLPKVDGKFYFELHDGIFVIVPDRYTDKAVQDIRQLLSNLPYEKAWGVKLPIQFPVDAKKGKSWGELKEVK